METSVIPDTIVNQQQYLNAMRKSLVDKVFFIDKVFEPIDTIVDFGCADGSLIKFLQDMFPDYSYIGYDKSEQMVNAAHRIYPDINVTDDWNKTVCSPGSSLINLSSVIHEVYSYCTEDEIQEFWDRVYKSGFKYISFRDMMLFEETRSTPIDEQKIVIPSAYKQLFIDYCDIWGNIDNEASYLHFILKSQYLNNGNLKRELVENYFPITVEGFMQHIPQNYEIVYSDNYILPYLKWWINKEYGIDITTPTHAKYILKKKTSI